MKFNWTDENILITGAGAGLGEALAKKTSDLGATVILISKRHRESAGVVDDIERKGNSVYYFSYDLENIDGIPNLYKEIIEKTEKIPTMLFNIVGYQAAGFIQNTPLEVYEKNFRINTLASIALIQNALPHMLSQKKGIIANVMSSIMYHSFPGVSSYCATKYALRAIHESLKLELANFPVKTLLIRPGSFRSNYWKNTDTGNRLKDFRLPTGEGSRDPAYVAEKICETIENGRENLDLSTFKDKVGYHLSYWYPKLLEKIITSRNRTLISKYPT